MIRSHAKRDSTIHIVLSVRVPSPSRPKFYRVDWWWRLLFIILLFSFPRRNEAPATGHRSTADPISQTAKLSGK